MIQNGAGGTEFICQWRHGFSTAMTTPLPHTRGRIANCQRGGEEFHGVLADVAVVGAAPATMGRTILVAASGSANPTHQPWSW